MNAQDIIKKDLLRRKIQEHIKNKPAAVSFVVKARFGDENTHWKVTREGKDFNIIEVNSRKDEFVLAEAEKKDVETSDDVTSGEPRKMKPGEQEPMGQDIGGLETDVDADDSVVEPEPQRTKTGEELQLKQLVSNKPVQDVDVEVSDQGGSVVLHLAGLDNPLKITLEGGQASYSLGELSRQLRTSTSEK